MEIKQTLIAILFSAVLFCSLGLVEKTQAGFGISPPYFQNNNLTRNSHFEQKIYLGRGDPKDELVIEITINVPGANDWISIDKGESFLLAKGVKQIPMIVNVDVPEDADFGSYKGNIRVRVLPTKAAPQGQVTVVLGAQIDVDLDVLDKVIYDFKVWKVNIPNLSAGHKVWWFFFPGRMNLNLQIENLGNIKAAPTKIEMDIYDSKEEKLLESFETTKIDKVEAFSTQNIFVKFPTRLPAGKYVVKFKIFKGEEVTREGSLDVSILPHGTIPGDNGYGLLGLNILDKTVITLMTMTAIVALVYGGRKSYLFLQMRKRRK